MKKAYQIGNVILLILFLTSNVSICQSSKFTALFIPIDTTDTLSVSGEADFTASSSILSIHLKAHNLRCGYHFTNIKENLEPDSYHVQYEKSPRFGAVCVQQNISEPEKLISETGEITLDEMTHENVKGTFDIRFKGGITGKEYILKGEFRASSME